MTEPVTLKRTLSLPVITFYGLGTIIGAGIYVLIGKVAGEAGRFLPFSFLLAGLLAAFTAMSYAELSSRYPKSAGAAIYVAEAWKLSWLSRAVGLLLVFTGIISAATIANGFTGYLSLFVDVSEVASIAGLIVALTALAAWGIKESAALITVITLIEVGGLLFVLYAGSHAAPVLSAAEVLLTMPEAGAWSGIFLGSFLAFYAFIGFEDMVNVVEEVKNPRRNMPLSIFFAIVVSTVLYIAIAVMAVMYMPVDALAQSKAPLAAIVENGGFSPALIGGISLIAVVNGALVQIIMAARVIYGMGRQNLVPMVLARLHPVRQTPLLATGLVAVIILVFALWFPLVTLAKMTSFIMLGLFALVNTALVTVKLKAPAPENIVSFPVGVPVIGTILCLMLLVLSFWR